jgi:L-aminopeptidase/D-esterase-like protein
VPAAAIYDLGVKENTAPTEEDAYKACKSAAETNHETGNVGIGTGASVGKLFATAKRMSGGLGRAEIILPNGIHVLAYAVVNSVGDVRDEKGNIIAGACDEKGKFVNCEKLLLAGNPEKSFTAANTTLIAVFTNALFSKIELKRISKMAVAGMGRAIAPIFTRYDGDLVFAFSVGEVVASELMIGTIAAEVTRLAIVNAVKNSIIL